MRFKKRRGVSPVIAELLLIVITVAIGTLVYSFASTAFGGFGAGFSNLVQNAGGQLTENVIIEQVSFLHNDTGQLGGCTLGPPPPRILGVLGGCAGDIFIGNAGSNTAVINAIFVTNVTGNPPIPGGPVTVPGNFGFFAYDSVSHKYDTALVPPILGGGNPLSSCAPSKCILSILPGETVMLRFQTTDLPPAGTTFAFTFITARGNQIVAYEKA